MTTGPLKPFETSDQIQLAWAGSTSDMHYLNFGDALSPVMVALMSGKAITRVPTKSTTPRLGAVGTIGHGFADGDVWFWGTGCSRWKNPSAPPAERQRFEIPAGSRFHTAATRGPVSEALLTDALARKPKVYGDPVWLLPRFYRPRVEKKWKIGVILHLSELADRSFTAVPKDTIRRFDIPSELAGDVHLITTVTPIDIAALGDKIDEILACERIVSTSLHGMVIAESYGIPCLYFAPTGPAEGYQTLSLDPDGEVDLRITDLYQGLGLSELGAWVQPRAKATDWSAVMAAIDACWQPKTCLEERLAEAFPGAFAPIGALPGQTIWQHPVLTGLQLQHDVAELRRMDGKKPSAKMSLTSLWRRSTPPESAKEALADSLNLRGRGLPLSWVASTRDFPYANLGDALSAVIVAAVSGLPVRHEHFDSRSERLVGVGTIGHAQKNGTLHIWGTGFDASRNATGRMDVGFYPPEDTTFRVHATRGPMSHALLQKAGLAEGAVAHGDPVWLLPRLWPCTEVKKEYDLGVIVHLSELESLTPDAQTKAAFLRYQIPPELERSVRIINTVTPATLEGLKAKIKEIVSCRAILSTSLHGLVIAETYSIPCAWFSTRGDSSLKRLPLNDEVVQIDHRMRDFYSATGATHLLTFQQDRAAPTQWEDPLYFIPRNWQPLNYSADHLLEAFPLPVAPPDRQGQWSLTEVAISRFTF